MTMQRRERAPAHSGPWWEVTLWLADGTRAAAVGGIDKRDTALLFAARALVGRDATLPECARARIEGWDRVKRERVTWYLSRDPTPEHD